MKIKTTETFIEDAIKIHGNKFDYSRVKYKGVKIPIEIMCINNHVFEQKPNDHLNGFGCKICSGWGAMVNDKDEFVKRATNINGNKFDYSQSVYVNHDIPLIIICHKHGEFKQSPKCHLIQKQGCPKCKLDILNGLAKKKAFTKDKFIQISNEIHKNLYDYSLSKYTNMIDKVEIICIKHGSFLQSPKCHINQRQGCPKCKTSKGELKIIDFLKLNNIKYSHQHSFSECINIRKLPFDFYLPDQNICIEFDGEQHFSSLKFFGGDKSFSYIQQNDGIKSKFCLDKQIKLIRIKYNQNIIKILTNNLL